LGFEILQFLGMAGIFVLVGLLWVRIVYRPGRTLEHWEGDRPGASHPPAPETRPPGPPAG